LKPQTRELVQLLADDVTGRMIVALRTGPHTAPQLEQLAGSSQKTVARALELLQIHGLIESTPQEAKVTGGRPSRVWQLVAEDELATFERACDAFKAGLLRRLLEDYDDDSDEAVGSA
jgi:predicted ArsR family transcriptional regulator